VDRAARPAICVRVSEKISERECVERGLGQGGHEAAAAAADYGDIQAVTL
jgi:hypothetical protein